ncbi:NAD(P)/FAD-dependent oxidoreductase [Candidatus Agathobaculum pullicola]|uniref:NAD(P)/FAD-dependent oxidoreductase n=1 Tax=Candidatus Agathobaculum pullicola TaxID=2838426 RepID=UPI003F8DC6BB
MNYDLVIIGGGPAGLSAAQAAWEDGCRSVCIVERDRELGGILNQCIHSGFGLHYFNEELTGPEYAGRFIDMVGQTGVDVRLDAMVLDITPDKQIHLVSAAGGYEVLQAQAVVLAMGCRERTRGAIAIPGTRPAGVFTAGTAQRYLNIEGYMVGKRVLILGSGDIGLIMARRMTLEGAKVLACVEVMPYSGGLMRNIVQCLHDFDIPLYLSHTITDIQGRDRVERVIVSKVGPDRRPIPGTEMTFDCDTVLLSVGLIPENELSRGANIQMDARTNGPVVFENMQTSLPGVFACGNVLHVHDLVDFVTAEAARAGRAAAAYCRGQRAAADDAIELKNGNLVGYTVPQRIHKSTDYKTVDIFFRVRAICGSSRIVVTDETGAQIAAFPHEHMAPGEMENIKLPCALLAKAKGTVTIAIEEAQA